MTPLEREETISELAGIIAEYLRGYDVDHARWQELSRSLWRASPTRHFHPDVAEAHRRAADSIASKKS